MYVEQCDPLYRKAYGVTDDNVRHTKFVPGRIPLVDEQATKDAERLLRLLWREALPGEPGTRGPKKAVSVDEVVGAAVAIADRAGYSQVSIRAVAAELGLRPMSLYTYVPSKEVLVALMVDAVAHEDDPIPADRPLRQRLAAIAEQARAELIRHPWMLDVGPWRPVLGPGRSRRYERRLSVVEGIGLTDVEMDHVVGALEEFAAGNARIAVAAMRSRQEISDGQWWQVFGPLLADVMPSERFPVSTRVGARVGELYQAPDDPDSSFTFGLDRLLDGLERYVAVRR